MLADELQILKRINLYGIAVDTQQWDVFGEIFCPNVVADYGEGAVFKGLASFTQSAAQLWGIFDGSHHAMSTTAWNVLCSTGRTLTYGDWILIRRGARGGDEWRGKGWYDDTWLRKEGGWRISRRVCRIVSWTGNPNVMQVDPAVDIQIKTCSLKEARQSGLLSFRPELN